MRLLATIALTVAKIALAILTGWLASELLIFCFASLRPKSPEYGPDYEGLVTVWIARILSILLALRVSFPSRIVPMHGDSGVHQPKGIRRTLGFDVVFFAACALVLLGVTIVLPLIERAHRYRASLLWESQRSQNLAALASFLPDWRAQPQGADLDARFVDLLRQTHTPLDFWIRGTDHWTEAELTRLVQFGRNHAQSSVGLVELYLHLIRDAGRSDDLRSECFLACLAFPSNVHAPPEQAWQTVASIPEWTRIVPAAVKRRHATRIDGNVGAWWLLREDAIELFERLERPNDELASVLADVLPRGEAAPATPGDPVQLLIRRGRDLLERWQQAGTGAVPP